MLGYGTNVINGDRIPLQTRAAYGPQSYGPSLVSVPTSQPNVPPSLGAPSAAAGSWGYADTYSAMGTSDSLSGYGTAENNALATAVAANNPWSFRDSPLLPALLFLIVGLVGLRLVHWR